jgi:acyl-coenzyme A thioesterase PaaI-like protein
VSDQLDGGTRNPPARRRHIVEPSQERMRNTSDFLCHHYGKDKDGFGKDRGRLRHGTENRDSIGHRVKGVSAMTDSLADGEPAYFHRKCFACGRDNPDGLHLQFTTSGEANAGTMVIDERFQGYEGIAQGGIVATILDTAMVQLLHDLFGGNPMTGKLDIRYCSTTPLHTPLTVNARVTQRRGNTCWAAAEILSGTDCCATARGIFKILSGQEGPPQDNKPS